MGIRRYHKRQGFSSRPHHDITPGPDTPEEHFFHNDLDSRLRASQLLRVESRKEGSEYWAWDRRVQAAARHVLGGLPHPPTSGTWCSDAWLEAAALTNFPEPRRQPLAEWPSAQWYADEMLVRLDYIRGYLVRPSPRTPKAAHTAVAIGIALGRLIKEAELKFSGLERRAVSGEKSASGGSKGGKARAAKYTPEYERWIAYAKSLDPKRFRTIHAQAMQVRRHFGAPFSTAKRILSEKLGSVPPTEPAR